MEVSAMDQIIEELQRRVEEAQRALKMWEAALKAARAVESGTNEDVHEAPPLGYNPKKEVQQPTVVGLAKKILRKHGALTTRELLSKLEERGKKTTLNSLTVSLNRNKGKHFKRENGKWHLLSQGEGGSEQAN
jgi:hypothetical protein